MGPCFGTVFVDLQPQIGAEQFFDRGFLEQFAIGEMVAETEFAKTESPTFPPTSQRPPYMSSACRRVFGRIDRALEGIP